jgi:hypothetical protein
MSFFVVFAVCLISSVAGTTELRILHKTKLLDSPLQNIAAISIFIRTEENPTY